jgi:hypothetical protein cdiviTM7_00940
MKLDNDFSDIMHEGKFEKHKPMLIALLVVAGLIIAVCGGVHAYLNSQSSGGETSKAGLVKNYEDSQQAKCIADVYEQHKTPDESDPEFYPKLIAGYDAHLSCYDKYPDENSSSNRFSIESARQSAIDASGSYKDTYLSSNSYDYNSIYDASTSGSTRIDPKTGCSYALTETEFIKCTDRYNALHGTATSGSSEPATQPPSQSSPSTPSTPPSSPDGSSSDGQTDQYAALNACLENARSLPTEASRTRAIQGCYQNHTP